LEAFTVDPSARTYNRAAGALAAFTVDPSARTYNRAAGALEAFNAEAPLTESIYIRSTAKP